MRSRLSLTGQLMVLQVAIVLVVMVGVAAVTVAQSATRAREVEGRRAHKIAEDVAANNNVRAALRDGDLTTLLRSAAESARQQSDSVSVVVTTVDSVVVASADPSQLNRTIDLSASRVLSGRGDVRTSADGGGIYGEAPVLSEERDEVGQLLGVVQVERHYPSVGESLFAALPNLLTYLGLTSLLGVLGSVLLARRVKRQTLGLEPREIAGLVEHREAMLSGIKEGVLAVDLHGTVTLVNDEASHLLSLPDDSVGRKVGDLDLPEALVDALRHGEGQTDQVVGVAGRLVILNVLPIHSHGRRIGSVTTLRDRTELMALRDELDVTRHVTDTLRAQAHEFSNRLHTISGLIELGEYDEVVAYVQRLGVASDAAAREITDRVHDPAVAALLLAKGSQAVERGVRLSLDPSTALPRLDRVLATDVATVVGNLVDNAFDAVFGSGDGLVDVAVVEDGGDVVVTVRDNGPGISEGDESVLFGRGWSTKGGPDERGIGLSLVAAVCRNRGGRVDVLNDGGAVFTARLPTRAAVQA